MPGGNGGIEAADGEPGRPGTATGGIVRPLMLIVLVVMA